MNNLGNYDHFIYLHIFKTAGITLRAIIERQYKNGEVLTLGAQSPLSKFLNLDQGEKDKIIFYQGHLKFGFHKLLNGSSAYTTILRDPLKRMISMYSYILEQENNQIKNQMAKDECKDLESFILNIDKYTPHGNNGQVRMISGYNYHFQKDDPENEWNEILPAPEIKEKDLLNIAINNIEKHFIFIGFTEKFDDTLLLLKKIFSWKNVYYQRSNVTKRRMRLDDIPERVKDLIIEKNKMDYQLYELVQKNFLDMVEKNTNYLKKEKRKLLILNRLYRNYKERIHPYIKKIR